MPYNTLLQQIFKSVFKEKKLLFKRAPNTPGPRAVRDAVNAVDKTEKARLNAREATIRLGTAFYQRAEKLKKKIRKMANEKKGEFDVDKMLEDVDKIYVEFKEFIAAGYDGYLSGSELRFRIKRFDEKLASMERALRQGKGPQGMTESAPIAVEPVPPTVEPAPATEEPSATEELPPEGAIYQDGDGNYFDDQGKIINNQ